MLTCCLSCGYTGNSKASVRAHLYRSHAQQMAMVKQFSLGRPKKEACDMCSLVHDDILRPGWAFERRFLERPHGSVMIGRLPPNREPTEWITLGRTLPVNKVRRIRGIAFYVTHLPTRIRLTAHNGVTGQVSQQVVFRLEPLNTLHSKPGNRPQH